MHQRIGIDWTIADANVSVRLGVIHAVILPVMLIIVMRFPKHTAVSEVSVIVLEFVLRLLYHSSCTIPL